MPLAGFIDGQLRISSRQEAEAWAQLKDDARARRVAVTMRCGLPGHPRTSKRGLQHYAHARGSDGCSAGETPQHLAAKAAAVEGAVAAGWACEPEVPGEGWVADVLASRGTTRVAFEMQWSRQSLDEYRFRQARYREAGIASIAWFARHVDGLPAAERSLPIFPLAVDEDGDATAMVDGTWLPLELVVQDLLGGRLQHREYVDGALGAVARVSIARAVCRACESRCNTWEVISLEARGACGSIVDRTDVDLPPPGVRRYEELPAIVERVREITHGYGERVATLGRQGTEAGRWLTARFSCPSCGRSALRRSRFDDSHLVLFVGAPVRSPHWCRDAGAGLCRQPEGPWAAGLEHPRMQIERTFGVWGRPRAIHLSELILRDGRDYAGRMQPFGDRDG